MPVMRQLEVGGVTYDTVGEASVTQVQTSGTKIATVSIDGTSTDLYAPAGGSSGVSGISLDDGAEPVSVPVTATGNATITIGDGLNVSDSGGTATLSAKTGTTSGTVAAGNHTHSGYQETLVSGTNIKTINSTSLLGSGDIAIAGLPSVSSSDNGKVLRVVSGAWAAASLPSASGVSF